jgi:hypothetical protein
MKSALNLISPATVETTTIPSRLRVRLWLIAWAVALLATPIPFCLTSPGLFAHFVMSVWAFPLGVAGYAFPEHRNPPEAIVTASLIAGWAFYAGLTIVGLLQRNRTRYFVVYTVLCLLLILNAVGCNVNMLKGQWNI